MLLKRKLFDPQKKMQFLSKRKNTFSVKQSKVSTKLLNLNKLIGPKQLQGYSEVKRLTKFIFEKQ